MKGRKKGEKKEEGEIETKELCGIREVVMKVLNAEWFKGDKGVVMSLLL